MRLHSYAEKHQLSGSNWSVNSFHRVVIMSLINAAYYTVIHYLLQRLHHRDGRHIFLELVISGSHECEWLIFTFTLLNRPCWSTSLVCETTQSVQSQKVCVLLVSMNQSMFEGRATVSSSINRRQTCISHGRFSVMADFCYKWGNIIPVLVRLWRMCADAKHGSSFQSTKRDLILSIWLAFQCCFVWFVKGFTVTNSQWILV